jgi:septal ring factor EnvC (AmiA/AmiB activator)
MIPQAGQVFGADTMRGSPGASPNVPGGSSVGVIERSTSAVFEAIEERKQQRLAKNREAAKACRRKKKQYLTQLEDRIHDLTKENMELRKKLHECSEKLRLFEESGVRLNHPVDRDGNQKQQFQDRDPRVVDVGEQPNVVREERTTSNSTNDADLDDETLMSQFLKSGSE